MLHPSFQEVLIELHTYFQKYKLSSLSPAEQLSDIRSVSDEIMAYLNYRELQMLGMNSVDENVFVQPMSPQTECAYHSKATAAAEKLEQQRDEKGCRCGA